MTHGALQPLNCKAKVAVPRHTGLHSSPLRYAIDTPLPTAAPNPATDTPDRRLHSLLLRCHTEPSAALLCLGTPLRTKLGTSEKPHLRAHEFVRAPVVLTFHLSGVNPGFRVCAFAWIHWTRVSVRMEAMLLAYNGGNGNGASTSRGYDKSGPCRTMGQKLCS